MNTPESHEPDIHRVAIVAPGSMGAAVARRLVEHGVEVLTALAGRGADSRARAAAAGMQEVTDERLVEADLVLSIVPPGVALGFAQRLAGVIRQAQRKPLFVDCNAVSPATVKAVGAVIEGAGAGFVDASIIGGPPRAGYSGPTFYACGAQAPRFQALTNRGLVVRVLDAGIGAASALKMCYAGITKGTTAVGTAMLLAAMRAGVDEALRAEMRESLRPQLAGFARGVPGMFPKAYRWVAEMQEIAAFAAADPAAARIFEGVSSLYERIAHDVAGEGREAAQLKGFLVDD